jgi:stress response protein YsnF
MTGAAFPGRLERLPDGGVRVVVPVHRDAVSVTKRTVVYEEVDIHREEVEEPARAAGPSAEH